MAGDELTTPAKSTTTSRPASPTSTTTLFTLPTETSGASIDKKQTRPTSPSTPPSQLFFKAKTQVGRVESLKYLKTKIPIHAHTTSLDEVSLFSAFVEELHQTFVKEHAHFEMTWPDKWVDHEYFDIVGQEMELVLALNVQLNRLKEDVEAITQSRNVTSSFPASQAVRLPEIPLPTFSGSYIDWPGYSELFTSLIINDNRLTDIERHHYLRLSLSGNPLRHANSYPLTGSSFQSCWDSLSKKFTNKRLLIQEQLNKLLNLSSISTRNATSLSKLMLTAIGVKESLTALGASEDMHNYILVHQATSCLDNTTLEEWETSVGSSTDYPRFEQLETFVEAKIAALERIEADAQASSNKKTPASSAATSRSVTRKSTAHSAIQPHSRSQSQFSPNSYPCDYCLEEHYIVMCPAFRKLSVDARCKLIMMYSLCRNCCGRHKTEKCKSVHRCKTCGANHHTMLHLAKAPLQDEVTLDW